jgi:YD repeat-containing protein
MSRFAKHIGSISLAIIAIGSTAVAAGNQTKSGVPSVEIHPIKPHLIATQAPFAPSLALLNADMAVKTLIGPGVLYVESYPSDQQQNAPPMHGHNRPPGILQRPPFLAAGRPHVRPKFVQPNNVISGSLNITGINPWWTYEEDAVAGLGKYMANVTTGNLIIQADDMATPHKGIELAFRRTYNSFSQHDYANTDGSVPSNYGDGWTNTFDAHIAYNDLNSGQGISIFDIDGARYDYSCTGGPPCTYVPPAGQFAKLVHDQSGDFKWTKKSGTVYWFHDPNAAITGVAGRLIEIVGRNSNTFLKFAYYFDANHTNSPHLNEIRVVPEFAGSVGSATQYVDLKFADFTCGTGNCRLLSTLTWIDMTTQVSYMYTASSSQLHVVKEPSDTSNTSLVLPQWYFYSTGTHLINSLNGPRWAIQPSADGSYYNIFYSGNAVTSIQYYGFIDPTITDASGSGQVQTGFPVGYGATPGAPYRTVSIVDSTVSPQPSALPAPAPSPTTSAACSASSSTAWYDTDGHESLYCFDSTSRVLQADHWTSALWLKTTQSWDASNDRTSTTDPRNKETDYAYDLVGNTIAVAAPSVTSIVNGLPVTFRPTSLYSYDNRNNVTSYCDPTWSHTNGGDWQATPAPSDTLCSGHSGETVNTWTQPSYDTYGELTGITTPTGYQTTIAYAGQGGTDFGQPTSVTATNSIAQNDGTTIQPGQTFTYDIQGNLVCYGKQIGTTTAPKLATWSLQYDSENRLTEAADPDDGSSFSHTLCGNTTSGNRTATFTSYFLDGQVASSQTPAEFAAGVSTNFTYDPDGDELSETHHFGGSASAPPPAAVTQKFYDAADRLVEVALPHDGTDLYSYQWLTRYLYDLSRGSGVAIRGSSSFNAHGGLFSTQEWVGGANWTDMKGYVYDALDRTIEKLYYSPGTCQPIPGGCTAKFEALAYDGSGALGLLQQDCNAVSQCGQYSYDDAGRLTLKHFTDGGVTPDRTYAYDPDSRVATITSTTFGTETHTYDIDGRETQISEPTGGGITSPAQLTYHYYVDGSRSGLDVASTGLSATGLISYSYRADGPKQAETLNYSGAQTFGWTYSNAGRVATQTDPYTGMLMGTTQSRYVATTWGDNIYGQVNGETMPWAGQYSNFAYDPEGENISYTGYSTSTPVSSIYNVRGELASQTWNGGNPSIGNPTGETIGQQDANGVMSNNCVGEIIHVGQFDFGSTCTTTAQDTIDPIAGALTSARTFDSYGCTDTDQWTYDAAGRSLQQTNSVEQNLGGICNGQYVQTSGTRTYDAEGHTTLCSAPGPADGSCRNESFGWGPNGHPTVFGPVAQPTFYTVHWDGDQPLFVTDSTGKLSQLNLDRLGMVVSWNNVYHLAVLDREFNGSASSFHFPQYGNSGYGAWLYPIRYNMGQGALPAIPHCSAGCQWTIPDIVDMLSPDGYDIGGLNFQGVRTYDPGTRQWSTPDAYSGVVDDPLSQKSYVWDNNNPMIYSDPSGYCAEDACVIEATAIGAGVAEAGVGVLVAGAAVATAIDQPQIGQGLSDAAGSLQNKISSTFSAVVTGVSGYISNMAHSNKERQSTRERHQKGRARQKLDRGGEKADPGRDYPRKPPKGWKKPWPPKQ